MKVPPEACTTSLACHQAIERLINLIQGQVLQNGLQRRNTEVPPGDGSHLRHGSFLWREQVKAGKYRGVNRIWQHVGCGTFPPSPRSASLRTSSRAKKGLPPERSTTRSRRACSSPATICSTSSRVWASESGCRARAVKFCCPPPQVGRRSSNSGRLRTSIKRAACTRGCMRCSTRSSRLSLAQCRSSNTTPRGLACKGLDEQPPGSEDTLTVGDLLLFNAKCGQAPDRPDVLRLQASVLPVQRHPRPVVCRFLLPAARSAGHVGASRSTSGRRAGQRAVATWNPSAGSR